MNDTENQPQPDSTEVPIEEGAEATLQPDVGVEFRSITGFLARIPHQQPWGYPSLIKFGNMVGNLAKAFALPYQTATDPFLGTLQTFPVPLMQQVYRNMAPALGWPPIPQLIEPMSAESKEEVKSLVSDYLTAIVECAQEGDTRKAARIILSALDQDAVAARVIRNAKVRPSAPARRS